MRTPGGLVGTTAPGCNSGMPGSQSSRAACTSASTLAEESSRLALPIQPHVQRAWFRRRSRTTTTTPRPPVESPIVARSPPLVVFCSPGCSAKPWPLPPHCRQFRKRQLYTLPVPRDGVTRTSLGDTRRLDGGQMDQPRISPDMGTPVPAVTSTCSTSSTWLTDVPRRWRTPSAEAPTPDLSFVIPRQLMQYREEAARQQLLHPATSSTLWRDGSIIGVDVPEERGRHHQTPAASRADRAEPGS